jgi:hypothetical protein
LRTPYRSNTGSILHEPFGVQGFPKRLPDDRRQMSGRGAGVFFGPIEHETKRRQFWQAVRPRFEQPHRLRPSNGRAQGDAEPGCRRRPEPAKARTDKGDTPGKALPVKMSGELVFDRTYRGVPRSDHYIFFHITTGRARSPETKARFYRRLVDNLAKAPGIRPEDVMVAIVNSTFEDWSFASSISAAAPAAAAGG